MRVMGCWVRVDLELSDSRDAARRREFNDSGCGMSPTVIQRKQSREVNSNQIIGTKSVQRRRQTYTTPAHPLTSCRMQIDDTALALAGVTFGARTVLHAFPKMEVDNERIWRDCEEMPISIRSIDVRDGYLDTVRRFSKVRAGFWGPGGGFR